MKKNSSDELIYREYKITKEIPVIGFFPGDSIYQNYLPIGLGSYHFHNCIEIGMCLSGGKNLFIEKTQYSVLPEEFFIIPPYSMHFAKNIPGILPQKDCCQYLYLDPEILLTDFYPSGLAPEMYWFKTANQPLIFSKKDHPSLYELCSYLFDEVKNYKDNNYTIKGLFLTLFTDFTRILGKSDNSISPRYQTMAAILPALQYIGENYPQKVAISELASLCYMSTQHFRNIFIEAMHQTPLKYLNALRLQKACELLYSTEISILEVAISAGFQSVSNFNLLFKATFLVTPTKWRDNRRTIQKKNVRHAPYTKT